MEEAGNIFNNKKGSALAATIIILLVLSILVSGFLTISLAESKTAMRSEKKKQAYYIAKAGAEAVSKYIIDNPGRAEGLINDPISNSQALGNGTFKVDVTGSINNVVNVESIGTVDNISQKVLLTLIPSLAAWTPPNFAEYGGGVFSEMGIELNESSYIDGAAVTNSISAKSIFLDWSTKVKGNLYIGHGGDPSAVIDYKNSNIKEVITGKIQELDSIKTYDMPKFPEFPDDLVDKGEFTAGWWPAPPYHINGNGYYSKIDVQSELVINTGAIGENRTISVKNLSVTGSGKITLEGNGNLILYVEDGLTVSNGATINDSGNPLSLLIYYSGSSEFFLGDNTRVYGTIFAETANLKIDNSGKVLGNIITNGDSIIIKGGSQNSALSIFAPNALVQLAGSASVVGSIIADKCIMSGASHVTFDDDIFFPDPLIHGTGSSELSFSRGIWK